MSVAGYIDVPLEVFSGLVTDLSPSELPAGVSPDCQDVAFELAGAVKTRPGLLAKVTGLGPNVNYIKTYIPQPGTVKTLTFDSAGQLAQETADGVVSLASPSLMTASSYCKSTSQFASATSQFAKEWLAFSDGKFGTDIPRLFDNVNLDRVSQAGPGAAITAVESGAAGNIPAGVHKVSVFFVDRQGYWTQPSPPTTWTASGGKKVTLTNVWTGPANIQARIVCFTAAGQSSFFFTNGQNGLPQMEIFDNNPANTGPLDFDFTDAQLQSGTSVDYLFRLLELGECAGVIDYNGRLIWWGERNKVNNFLNLTFDGGFNGNVPLGWTLDGTFGTGGSQERTNVVWGSAYNMLGNGNAAVGLIFQSAYQDINGVPILRPNVGYSVRARVRLSGSPGLGASFKIDLASSTVNTTGMLLASSQVTSSYQEFTAVLGTAAQLATIPSDLVMRVFTTGTPNNGAGFIVDNIEVYPTNQPYNDSTLRVSRVFDPESYDGVNGVISVTPNNGQRITSVFKIKERLFIVKERSLYVTQDTGNSEPAQWTVTEVSNKIGTPSINGVSVGEDWAILADRSGAYLTDGGEPRKLSQEIQPTWDAINDNALQTIWTAVETRTRRMYFGVPTMANITGSGASRSSNVVTITTSAAHSFSVGGAVTIAGVSDPSFNSTFVISTIPSSTTFTYTQVAGNASSGNGTAAFATPNKIYTLDYRGMNSAAEIADGHAVQLFIYTGTLRALSKARRWAPWNVTSNSGAVIERFDGTAQMAIGNGAGNGKLYLLSDTQFTDDGAAINSYYTTYFFLTHEQEAQFRITPHRKLVPYLTMFVEGSGTLAISAFANSLLTTAQAIPSLTLSNPATRDLERPISVLSERIAFRFGTNVVGSWFKMQKFIPAFVQDPAGPVRGA